MIDYNIVSCFLLTVVLEFFRVHGHLLIEFIFCIYILLWVCLAYWQVHLSCLTEILNNFARILPHTPSLSPTAANLLLFLYHHIPAQCE